MRQAKLGAVFMIAVVALASLGVAYSHWQDTITIEVKADMGRLGFGFVTQRTNDFGPHHPEGELFPTTEGWVQGHYDPDCPEGVDRVCGRDYPPYNPAKNVASTNCELKNPKVWHDGSRMWHDTDGDKIMDDDEICYNLIEVVLDNVYPNYAPNLYFEIANPGCVPIEIVGHWLIDDGIDGNDFADGIDEPDTWFFMYKCHMYAINLQPIDEDPDLKPDIEIGLFCNEEDQQIDPCNVDEYGISFHILQPYPQCHTFDFEFKLYGVQWNWPVIPPYTPTESPLPDIPPPPGP